MKSKKKVVYVALAQGLLLLVLFAADAAAFAGQERFHEDLTLKTISQLPLNPSEWSAVGPLIMSYENAVAGVRAAQKTLWTDLKAGNSGKITGDYTAVEAARTAARDQKKILWTELETLAAKDPALATALADLKAKRLAKLKARLNSLCKKIEELGGTCSQ